MKKFIIKTLFFIGVVINFCGTCSKPIDDKIAEVNLEKVLKHNYIVVNSVSNTPAQVEVSYSVFVAGNSENIVKTEILTTPFVIGGEEVKVVYDSIHLKQGDRILSGHTSLKSDYTPKGGEYLSIKNLSSEMLEYCVIGNNKITFDSENVVKSTPLPIYKGAPILSLLKPDEIVYDPILVAKYEDGIIRHKKQMTLKKPTFGDITLTNPYTLQEIMTLYREEATNGKTLYASLEDYVNDRKTMGKNNLFGYIYPGKTLDNNGQIWFLNVRTGFYPIAGRIDVND